MALRCPIGFDTKQLRAEVSEMYSRVASDPNSDFHFHRGPAYAASHLGYDPARLAALPERATRSFAGIANPLLMGAPTPGGHVLDVGCGAGMDLLLAAQDAGPTGLAIGVDMTQAMLDQVRCAADELEGINVSLREGDAEDLPVDDASVDLVISNGVINLTTDKVKAFSEIARVLKPAGRLQLGDIVVANELDEDIRNDIDLWAA